MAPDPTRGTSALIFSLAGIAAVLSGCGGGSSPTPAPTPAPPPACTLPNCTKVSDAQSCDKATCVECSATSVPDCNKVVTPAGTTKCLSQATCQDCKASVIEHCAATNTPEGTKDCKKQATCKTCEANYEPFADDKGSYCGLSCPLPHCTKRGATPRDAKDCKEVTTPCEVCEDLYEPKLDPKSLLPSGTCQTKCTETQVQNGCARHTCTESGCQCVPGFMPVMEEKTKEPTIARFLSDAPRTSCSKSTQATKMTFYMYRAQSDESYPPDCTDLASAAGVLFYLHNEVVKYCRENVDKGNPPVPTPEPRHNGITRIIRYTVDVHNTNAVFAKQQGQFSHFVPFDKGQCTWNGPPPSKVPDCTSDWKTYGYSVGCQLKKPDPNQNETYVDNAWYSLPGACPNKTYESKDATCKKNEPGGSCDSVTGEKECTWHIQNPDGDSIYLDELSGIAPTPFKYDPKFYLNWCTGGLRPGSKRGGNTEYDPKTDKGIGTTFWDDKGNPKKNEERVLALLRLFAKNFPTEDAIEKQPYCDGF